MPLSIITHLLLPADSSSSSSQFYSESTERDRRVVVWTSRPMDSGGTLHARPAKRYTHATAVWVSSRFDSSSCDFSDRRKTSKLERFPEESPLINISSRSAPYSIIVILHAAQPDSEVCDSAVADQRMRVHRDKCSVPLHCGVVRSRFMSHQLPKATARSDSAPSMPLPPWWDRKTKHLMSG